MRSDPFVRQVAHLKAVAAPRAEAAMGEALDLFLQDGVLDLNEPNARQRFLSNMAQISLKAVHEEALRMKRENQLPLAV